MSRETFEFHYGKHLQTYIDNLNRLIQGTPFEDFSLEEIIMKADGGILNNAAQTWNHTFFFKGLTPSQPEIPQRLLKAIEKAFGSFEEFKTQPHAQRIASSADCRCMGTCLLHRLPQPQG